MLGSFLLLQLVILQNGWNPENIVSYHFYAENYYMCPR